MLGGALQGLFIRRLAFPVIVQVACAGKGNVEGAIGELVIMRGALQQLIKLVTDGLWLAGGLAVESSQFAVFHPGGQQLI